MDLAFSRVDNGYALASFAAGLACQLIRGGPRALLPALLGALLPFLLLVWLWALRMLGAGDIKLLMALGAFLGPRLLLLCLWGSLCCGAFLSLPFILSPESRLLWLSRLRIFLLASQKAGRPEPYRKEGQREGTIPFALAILGGAILTAGWF